MIDHSESLLYRNLLNSLISLADIIKWDERKLNLATVVNKSTRFNHAFSSKSNKDSSFILKRDCHFQDFSAKNWTFPQFTQFSKKFFWSEKFEIISISSFLLNYFSVLIWRDLGITQLKQYLWQIRDLRNFIAGYIQFNALFCVRSHCLRVNRCPELSCFLIELVAGVVLWKLPQSRLI